MKLLGLFLLLACVMGLAYAAPQSPPQPIKDPKISASGGGQPNTGYNLNLDVRKNVWESQNGRHSVDATGGYSQHLGGPYGNSRPDFRGGAVYTYKF
ncbi:diptericin-D-like [Haematobia irritans]|uniref:diptericin-D-like n=1 Tax=Haematobia irritans TaxID=7368 RepID=UPI003F4F5EAA